MSNTAALAVRPSDLTSLWERDEPDLVLDADDGTIRPFRRVGSDRPVASSIGRAVAAAPVAVGVVLSEVARWD